MEATLNIDEIRLPTKTSIRVLGIQIDSKLKWSSHIQALKRQYESKLLAFGEISRSTWGAGFQKARIIYTSVLRPTISYGVSIWYSPGAKKGTSTTKTINKTLETMQNRGLRQVTGAYKAVGGAILEKEADIPPIAQYLETRMAKELIRTYTSPASQFIRSQCEKIRLRHPATRRQILRQKPTPQQTNIQWLREEIPEHIDNEIFHYDTIDNEESRLEPWGKAWKRRIQQKWDERWEVYKNSVPMNKRPPSLVATTHNPKKLHADSPRALISIITQIRTEKIGLNAFLSDARVPNYLPSCSCGWPRQTAKHIIRFCPDWSEQRRRLLNLPSWRNYQKLLETPSEVKEIARFLQQTNLLPQFSLGLGLPPTMEEESRHPEDGTDE